MALWSSQLLLFRKTLLLPPLLPLLLLLTTYFYLFILLSLLLPKDYYSLLLILYLLSHFLPYYSVSYPSTSTPSTCLSYPTCPPPILLLSVFYSLSSYSILLFLLIPLALPLFYHSSFLPPNPPPTSYSYPPTSPSLTSLLLHLPFHQHILIFHIHPVPAPVP